jgi:hypothetical protein
MLKFLLYIGFIFFLIYWILILPFKAGPGRVKPPQRKRTGDEDINVDQLRGNRQQKNPKGYDGGDYVDYEEIK